MTETKKRIKRLVILISEEGNYNYIYATKILQIACHIINHCRKSLESFSIRFKNDDNTFPIYKSPSWLKLLNRVEAIYLNNKKYVLRLSRNLKEIYLAFCTVKRLKNR